MNKIPSVFYESPITFTLKQKLILFTIPPIVAVCIKGLMKTCRYEVRNLYLWDQVVETYGRAIIAIWHDSMGFAAWHYRNTGGHTLVSYSFDGELATRVLRHFGLRTIRGSSTRGGSEGLRGLTEAAKHIKILGFTLDGPKGPRRVAKPGIAILAARTGLPIIPHAFAIHPAWRLNSWDKFPIPKPFGRLVSAYGPAIAPPLDDSPDAVEQTRLQVENDLNRLHAEIEKEITSS